MSKTIIQVPIEKNLRDQALHASSEMGFSSLQESIRLFLSQLAKRKVDIRFTTKLSARSTQKYNQVIDEIEKEKGITKTKNVDDFFDKLDE